MNTLGGTIIGVIVTIIVALLTAIIISATYAWQIALVSLSIMPILLIGQLLSRLAQVKGLVQLSYQECDKVAADAIINYRSIKAFNLQNSIITEYLQPLES